MLRCRSQPSMPPANPIAPEIQTSAYTASLLVPGTYTSTRTRTMSPDWARLHLLCAAPAGDAQGVPDAVHRHCQPQAHQRPGPQQQVPQGGSNHQAGKWLVFVLPQHVLQQCHVLAVVALVCEKQVSVFLLVAACDILDSSILWLHVVSVVCLDAAAVLSPSQLCCALT